MATSPHFVSSETTARHRLFEEHVANAQHSLAALDTAYLHPGMQDTMAAVGSNLAEAMLPNISNDGKLWLPPSCADSNGPVILPLLPEDKPFYADESLLAPTSARMQLGAGHTGLTYSDSERKAREILATTDWPSQPIIASKRNLMGTIVRDEVRTLKGGTPYHLASRGLILVSPQANRNTSPPSFMQGMAMVHEGVHNADIQNRWYTRTPAHLETLAEKARLELRAYHANRAIIGLRMKSYQHLGVATTTRCVEQLRQQDATPDEPFRTTQHTINTMVELGII